MGSLVKKLGESVAAWTNASVHPHRFGALEIRVNRAEVGHVHFWGDVDIPFPRSIRDILVTEQLAQPHRWLPDSGWITFHMSGNPDLERALWLLRLSWLRYMLKIHPDPQGLFEREREELHLDARLGSLLARFIPPGGRTATAVERSVSL